MDTHPEWLTVLIAHDGLTLNGGSEVFGRVVAPNGAINLNGRSRLQGTIAADRITINQGTLD